LRSGYCLGERSPWAMATQGSRPLFGGFVFGVDHLGGSGQGHARLGAQGRQSRHDPVGAGRAPTRGRVQKAASRYRQGAKPQMDAPVVRMVPIDSVRAEFEKAWPISSEPEQAKKDKDTRAPPGTAASKMHGNANSSHPGQSTAPQWSGSSARQRKWRPGSYESRSVTKRNKRTYRYGAEG